MKSIPHITLQRTHTAENKETIKKLLPGFTRRTGGDRPVSSSQNPTKLVDRHVVKFSVKEDKDVKEVKTLISKSEKFLGKIGLEKKKAVVENKLKENKEYYGEWLIERSETKFKEPLTKSYAEAKTQIIKDIKRGVELNGISFKGLPLNFNISEDATLKYHLYALLDFVGGADNGFGDGHVEKIQEALLNHCKERAPEGKKEFITMDLIKTVFTKKDLLIAGRSILFKSESKVFEHLESAFSRQVETLVSEKGCEELVMRIFPKMTQKKAELLIKGYSQDLSHPLTYMINNVDLNENGYHLTKNFETNIYFDPEDNKIHVKATMNKVAFLEMENSAEHEIKGSYEIEYTLEEDGFVLNDIIISDDKLAALIFAKGPEDMKEALGAYGL